MSDIDEARHVADSLDAPVELLPHLPELLADLEALGSAPAAIVDLLRFADLPSGFQTLELGCGKGAVSVALARELGAEVRGVDLFDPFVQAARRRARRAGVDDTCRFERGDLRQALATASDFDAVVYASLDVLGRHDECVAALRQAVCPGGFLVVDDMFLADGDSLDAPGYEHYAGRDEVRRRLTAHGDRILREVLVPPAEAAADNARATELIRGRARTLATRHPADADRLHAYVRRQEEECALLDAHCVGALWLLERASSGD